MDGPANSLEQIGNIIGRYHMAMYEQARTPRSQTACLLNFVFEKIGREYANAYLSAKSLDEEAAILLMHLKDVQPIFQMLVSGRPAEVMQYICCTYGNKPQRNSE